MIRCIWIFKQQLFYLYLELSLIYKNHSMQKKITVTIIDLSKYIDDEFKKIIKLIQQLMNINHLIEQVNLISSQNQLFLLNQLFVDNLSFYENSSIIKLNTFYIHLLYNKILIAKQYLRIVWINIINSSYFILVDSRLINKSALFIISQPKFTLIRYFQAYFQQSHIIINNKKVQIKMAQKITKMVQQCFDVISKDTSVMNNFKKDHSVIKVYTHNKKVTNFFENLLLKNKTYKKYDEAQEYHNNIFFSLKSLLDNDLKQKPIQKQTIIEKGNKISKDVSQCINCLAHLKTQLQKEKPFSEEDRKSLMNTKDYILKLSTNLSIVDENLNTIIKKWDDLVGRQFNVQVSLTKIMQNAQDLSREIVGYAYRTRNVNQNTLYSFSLDQNYCQIKKTNQDVIKTTNIIKTMKGPISKVEVATFVDSTYLLVVFNYEAIIRVKESFINYINKNACSNFKATQQHINSLRKYITDIQTQLQSINKLYLGRQLPSPQKQSQKSPQSKPPTSTIQTPTKDNSSQNINSPTTPKSQSQTQSPQKGSSQKPQLSNSRVSDDSQSRFSDINEEKANKSPIKQQRIQQQKGVSPLSQLIRLVSQNDETLAKLIPKSQHQPPTYTTFNVNYRDMLSLQQKNNKVVQIAIDLFDKHQNDYKKNVSNSSSAQQIKEQNSQEIKDALAHLSVFEDEFIENFRKLIEENAKKNLVKKHKQVVDVLNAQINKLTVQLSGKEETHSRVVAGLKGEIDKINLQLESKLNEIQIQRDIQTSIVSELDKFKVQNNKLKQRIITLQTTNKQLSDKNNLLQQRNLQLRQQTLKSNNQQQSITELKKQKEILIKQRNDLIEQRKKLKQNVQLIQNKIQSDSSESSDEQCERFDTQQKQEKDDFQKKKQTKLLELSGKKSNNDSEHDEVNQIMNKQSKITGPMSSQQFFKKQQIKFSQELINNKSLIQQLKEQQTQQSKKKQKQFLSLQQKNKQLLNIIQEINKMSSNFKQQRDHYFNEYSSTRNKLHQERFVLERINSLLDDYNDRKKSHIKVQDNQIKSNVFTHVLKTLQSNESQISELKNQIKTLNNSISSEKKTIQQLKTQLNDINEFMKGISEIKEAEKILQQKQKLKYVEKFESVVDSSKNFFYQIISHIASYFQEREKKADQKSSILASLIQSLGQDKNTIQYKLTSTQTQLTLQHQKTSTLTAQLQRLNKTFHESLTRNGQQLALLKSQKQNVESKKQMLEQILKERQLQMQEQEQQIEKLQTKINKMQVENKVMQDKVKEIKKKERMKLTSLTTEGNDYDEECTKEIEFQLMKAELSRKNQMEIKLTAKIRQMQKEIKDLKSTQV